MYFCLMLVEKLFTYIICQSTCVVVVLDTKLFVDGEEIDLNEFVIKILAGTIVGAVTSLRGIKKEWKEIKIEVKK